MKIIFIFEAAAFLVMTVCALLLIQKSRRRPKQPEDKPKPQKRTSMRPRRCKRRPKGQTGRKHPNRKRKEV